jgi:hypothetical protein
MASLTGYEDLDLALDLLVAHASINADLRQELLNNPEAACVKHGINLPVGTKLIFSSMESPVLLKEIPVTSAKTINTTQVTDKSDKVLASAGLNGTATETETVQTAVEATTDWKGTAEPRKGNVTQGRALKGESSRKLSMQKSKLGHQE